MRDFCPSIDRYATTTLTLQKVHKGIVKLIHIEQFRRDSVIYTDFDLI